LPIKKGRLGVPGNCLMKRLAGFFALAQAIGILGHLLNLHD
jgi:hypothetical protein